MPIEAVVYVVAAVLLFAAGAGTREAVRWARGEVAFSRAIRGELDAFAARFSDQTGRRVGLIEDVPPHMAEPAWAGLSEPQDPGEHRPEPRPWPDDDAWPDTDDEDAFPRDEQRVLAGAWRRETVRGDGNQSVWPSGLVEAAQASGMRQAVRLGGRHSRALAEADTDRLPVERLGSVLADGAA